MRNPRADEKIRSIRDTIVPYELVRGGISLTILKNVYPTSELSELLVETMDHPDVCIKEGKYVLDYGTGTGFLALQAARRGAAVVAVDINSDAISCAQFNACKFGFDNMISFRCGKNLSTLRNNESFDAIFAGMPWDDAPAVDDLERSVYDESFEMRRSLFARATQILRPGGRIIISSSEEHSSRYPELYQDMKLSFEIIARRNIKGLWHYALLITPKTESESSSRT